MPARKFALQGLALARKQNALIFVLVTILGDASHTRPQEASTVNTSADDRSIHET
jgi:hypothetical protein